MLLIFWETGKDTGTEKVIEKSLLDALSKVNHYKLPTADYKKHIVKVIFTDSKKIRSLNKSYRKIDKETDVLSFAELDLDKKFTALKEEKNLGEIYINYDWIKKEKTPVEYASKLFIHGYLHLLGYDHEKDHGEMEKLEKKLIRKIFP